MRRRPTSDTPTLDRYLRYLRLFDLEGQDWSNLWVCDYGCGAMGGMLNVIHPRRGFAVDYHAHKFPEGTVPILGMDRHMQSTIPAHSCDVVFLLDVLDHTCMWHGVLDEVGRIIRRDGLLFLFCHLHEDKRPHRLVKPWRLYLHLGSTGITVGKLQRRLDRPWTWLERRIGKDVVIDPYKRALWGVLKRREV